MAFSGAGKVVEIDYFLQNMIGAHGPHVQICVVKEQKVDFGTAKEIQLAGRTEKKLLAPVQTCVVLVKLLEHFTIYLQYLFSFKFGPNLLILPTHTMNFY